ncbi:MAG TPA: MBL fold metallo-hydrolase [Gaiellaceae bacterium]|nr:MBL fold metallo-hydrolase [Gaiellaceae bacterium]
MQVQLLGSGGFAPSDRRETASALVTKDGEALLIDAGTGARRLLTEPSLLDGVEHLHVVLTHFHLDHVVGLFFLAGIETPLTIWGAGETLESLPTRSLVDRLLRPPFAPASFQAAYEDVRELDIAGETQLGPFALRARVQPLHSNPTLALRLDEALVWCTDTAHDEQNVEFAGGAHVLFHEAFSDAGSPTHTAAQKAAELAAAAGVERLVLIHLDPELQDEAALLECARAVFPAVELAVDGLVVTVP